MFGTEPRETPSHEADDGGAEDELEVAIREDREGRGIPHERVKAMRSAWETRAEKRARETALKEARQSLLTEFAPVLEELGQLRELSSKFDPAAIKGGIAEAFLESLGVKKEKPAPKYMTEEEVSRRFEEQKAQFQRETKSREVLQRAHLDLQAAKQKHEKWFSHFPVLEELAAAVWSTPQAMKAGIGLDRICDTLVKQLEEGVGKFNQAYVEEKKRDATETPIVPGSTPTPGRKPPQKVDHSPEGTAKRALEFLEKAAR
jgi:hypothetical protein